MNRRRYSRVSYETIAEIQTEKGQVGGTVINLSMNGLCVTTPTNIPIDTNVQVTVQFKEHETIPPIDLRGVVVRSDEESVAIRLVGVELDSFIHLKKIVAYNAGDDDMITNEFYRTDEETED